jgi:metal-responsive CopG/Arc/MetJ family transcriptional regulator
MHRTQIYLDDDLYVSLEKESARRSLSISELIRVAVRKDLAADETTFMARMKKAVGAWKDVSETPDAYVRRMRKDRTVW